MRICAAIFRDIVRSQGYLFEWNHVTAGDLIKPLSYHVKRCASE